MTNYTPGWYYNKKTKTKFYYSGDSKKDTSNYMNELIRDKSNKENNKKKYLNDTYTPKNVNDYFSNINTYEELEEFRNDYFNKLKFMPYITPIKHPVRQWVAFIEKIDDDNISFSVLSWDSPSSRKTKSSVKNFVKNYKVHME